MKILLSLQVPWDICSVGTSSGSSSFTARFYKGSLKVSKGRARLDHKIAKLEMFGTSLIFVLNSLKKARAQLYQSLSLARLGAYFWQECTARTRSFTFSKSSSSIGSGNSRLVQPTLDILAKGDFPCFQYQTIKNFFWKGSKNNSLLRGFSCSIPDIRQAMKIHVFAPEYRGQKVATLQGNFTL